MSDTPHPAMAESDPPLPAAAERDLADLPPPPRRARAATLGALGLLVVAASALALALRGEVAYALVGAPPRDLGELSAARAAVTPTAPAGTYVRAAGQLTAQPAIKYRRPLGQDSYRLARLEGDERVWVEVRVPDGLEDGHFLPPTSFVGRLVPFSGAGLRHAGLRAELRSAVGAEVPADAWLLIDGESPRDLAWAQALAGLLVAFAAFGAWGLYRLLRPVKDPE